LINNLSYNVSNRNKTILIFVIFSFIFFISCLCISVLTGGIIIGRGGLGGILLALIYFSISIPFSFVVLYLLRLLDVYEKEDWSHIIFAFIWGALGATLFSLITNELNITISSFICGQTFGNIFGTVVSAPIFEEFFKLLAIVIILLFLRTKFNSPIDGMVYAAAAGLGFKLIEDYIYIANGIAIAGLSGGFLQMILRWVFGFILHSLMTSFVGFSIGFATLTKDYLKKILYVTGGYLLSIGSHFLWNFSSLIFSSNLLLIAIIFPFYTIIYIFLNILFYIRAVNVERNIMLEVLKDEINENLIDNNILNELINLNLRNKRKSSYLDSKLKKLYDIYMNLLASYSLLKKQYLNSNNQEIYNELQEKKGILYILKPILFVS
jgi:RsiW-degrading membrane proteinase PrsW (M82 family)